MKPVQSRMARAALQLGIRDVATMAQVAPSTVSRFEAGEDLKPRTIEAIRRAFEQAGIAFTNGDEPGVRVRKKRR